MYLGNTRSEITRFRALLKKFCESADLMRRFVKHGEEPWHSRLVCRLHLRSPINDAYCAGPCPCD